MKKSWGQMLYIVCILAIGVTGITSFTLISDADPSEVTHYRWYDVNVCNLHGDFSQTLTDSETYASGWHEGTHWSGTCDDSAVIVARATLDLAKANKDAAQAAVDGAKDLGEKIAALAWKAAAEIALNLADAAHDDAVQKLNECMNPPCPCGCDIEGCDTCEEHASTCSGGNSGSSSGYYE